jgi:hypothetical protein
MGHHWHTLATVALGLFHSFINVEGLNPLDLKVKREVRDNVWRLGAARKLPSAPRLVAFRLEDISPFTLSNFSFCAAVHNLIFLFVFSSWRSE